MFNPPAQIQFEEEQRDIFKHGDFTALSSLTGIHLSMLSRQFNPEEPEKSIPYQYAVLLEACKRLPEGKSKKAAVERLVARHTGSGAGVEVTGDEIEEQIVDAMMELQIAIRKGKSADKLMRARALIPLLEGYESEFMVEGLEDSEEAVRSLRKAG